MTDYLLTIVEGAQAKRPPGSMRTRVVAIDGPGGAGKTSLARCLVDALGGAPVVHTDDFASWANPIDWWPRLLGEVLEPLGRNEPARYLPTSWDPGHEKTLAEVPPTEFVVLEGVTASREAFRPYLTYSVWIETPRDLRLRRGLERDGEEMRAQWEQWMAREDAWAARERPREHVDLVLPGDRNLWR